MVPVEFYLLHASRMNVENRVVLIAPRVHYTRGKGTGNHDLDIWSGMEPHKFSLSKAG